MRVPHGNPVCDSMQFSPVPAQSLIYWVALAAVGAMLAGCRARNLDEEELEVEWAAAILRDTERCLSPYKERAQAALMKLDDDTLDTKPVVILASIECEDPNTFLYIICFDEDRDLRGICIREQYEGGKDTVTVLEEDYPVFLALTGELKSGMVERRFIQVEVREQHERKDELSWLRYENLTSDTLIRRAITKTRAKRRLSDTLIRSMPPIYVSVSEPNNVRVQVSVYDRAGHMSEWIEVERKRRKGQADD